VTTTLLACAPRPKRCDADFYDRFMQWLLTAATEPSWVETAYAIRSYPTVTTLRRPWGRLVR